jgi:uncharacterized membrane protein YfcA
MLQHLMLMILGLAVGAVGTLMGAGGGFVLLPVLLLLYHQASPETLTAISLAVVFFNASSGSLAYARLGRIDYRSGLLFAAATIPGAVTGALSTSYIPRRTFDVIFGVVMIVVAVYLIRDGSGARPHPVRNGKHETTRTITEKSGKVHTYTFDPRLGMGISLLVGYVSSLLGIGGGIIHVPALVRLLNIPVHVATATSHFILAIMALTGTLVHLATGSFSHGGLHRTLFLGMGVLIGAQGGAWLSSRVHGVWILRGLAVALGLVGIRIFIMGVGL